MPLPDGSWQLAIDASRATVAAKTGTEWYSLEIIRALATLTDRPALTLYTRATPSPEGLPVAADIATRVIQAPRLWTHVGLSAALLRDRPGALFVPAHVLPVWRPAASVVTIHDLGYLNEPEAHPRRARALLDATTRWNARVARAVIAISSQTRDDLVRHYGVDRRKIHVVHSGVDHGRFRRLPAAEVASRLASLGITSPYLLFLSTVQPRKNVVRLVEAFEALPDTAPALVIAGRSGWLSAPIEQRIAASPAAGRIHRLGHVPDDLTPALYNGAQAFVLPSLYEGFGMGVLEAMACGCPVVTSDRSSLPEVAGGAAILVDPTDADAIRAGVERTLAPSTRAALVEAGARRAADFSWERAARETLAVIMGAVRGA